MGPIRDWLKNWGSIDSGCMLCDLNFDTLERICGLVWIPRILKICNTRLPPLAKNHSYEQSFVEQGLTVFVTLLLMASAEICIISRLPGAVRLEL
jgi:hypothetical protein